MCSVFSPLRTTSAGRALPRKYAIASGSLALPVLLAAALVGMWSAACPGQEGTQTDSGTIAVADLVRILMHEDPEVMFEGVVSASGTIPIPYLGEFHLAGLTSAQAKKGLEQALCKDLYQAATMSVTLVRRAPGKVYVYGAVKKPGVVPLPENGRLSVLQLISEVENVTNWASPEDAYILRGGADKTAQKKIPVNLAKIFAAATPDTDMQLEPEDVLFVPGLNGDIKGIMTTDNCEIIVVGEVQSPGIITFAPGEQRTLMRAVFKAGGFSKFAKDKAVRLIRYGKNNSRTEEKVDAAVVMEDGFLDKDIELLPGDMVIVPQKMINF